MAVGEFICKMFETVIGRDSPSKTGVTTANICSLYIPSSKHLGIEICWYRYKGSQDSSLIESCMAVRVSSRVYQMKIRKLNWLALFHFVSTGIHCSLPLDCKCDVISCFNLLLQPHWSLDVICNHIIICNYIIICNVLNHFLTRVTSVTYLSWWQQKKNRAFNPIFNISEVIVRSLFNVYFSTNKQKCMNRKIQGEGNSHAHALCIRAA